MTIKSYSTTSSNNTSINSSSLAEGQLPSTLNNSVREITKDIRDGFNSKEWFELGTGDQSVTWTRGSSTTITVSADITSSHHVGRRVRVTGNASGVLYGLISASAYSSPNTTLTFTFDSGSINSGDSTLTSVEVGSPYNNPANPIIDEDNMASNSAILPPSQQSVKAYVDAQDLDFAGASGSGSIDLDSQTFTIASGEGIDTVASGQTLTVSGEDATTSNKGIASFSSDNFAVSSGAVTIKDGGIANAELVNDSVNYGGITVALGASDTTPAFNLQDATNYPASSISGTIAENQLASGINAEKIGNGDVNNTELSYINSLSSNAQTQINTKLTASNNLSDLSSASTSRTNLGLGSISTQGSNNVTITGGSITGLGSPSNGSSAVNRTYVDNLIAGLKTRIICRVASTSNVNLANALENGDTLDGVTLQTGNRILIRSQTTASENGIYTVPSSGSASRDTDFDTASEISGQIVIIQEGSTNADKIFMCTSDSDLNLGTDSVSFSQVQPSNTGTVTSAGITQSGSEFSISGSPITSSGNVTLGINRISATKIGSSANNISDTEFGYLDGVTSSIQTQLNDKATKGFSIALAVAL